MSIKNKALKNDSRARGKMEMGKHWSVLKSPELFYNSDEFRKIKNRKKGKK